MGTAPLERDPACFEPADQGRAGHAQRRGSLAGRQHLVGYRCRVHVSGYDAGEDRADQAGWSSR